MNVPPSPPSKVKLHEFKEGSSKRKFRGFGKWQWKFAKVATVLERRKKDNFAMIIAKSRGEICQNLFVLGNHYVAVPIHYLEFRI